MIKNNKKSLALSYELVVAIFSLLFVSFLVIFLRSSYNDFSKQIETAPPKIDSFHKFNIINTFLEISIDKDLREKYKIKKEIISIKDLLLSPDYDFKIKNEIYSIEKIRFLKYLKTELGIELNKKTLNLEKVYLNKVISLGSIYTENIFSKENAIEYLNLEKNDYYIIKPLCYNKDCEYIIYAIE